MPETPDLIGGGFRPVQAISPGLLFQSRPSAREDYLHFADPDGFECFIHSRAARHMVLEGRRAGSREVIGRLGGRHCMDERGDYVLVEKAALIPGAKGAAASIVADPMAQAAGRAVFDRTCRGMESVGWWHTHPNGIGVFYSSVDRRNQATWTNPNAIGVVVDPQCRDRSIAVYRGPGSREMRLCSGPSELRLNEALGGCLDEQWLDERTPGRSTKKEAANVGPAAVSKTGWNAARRDRKLAAAFGMGLAAVILSILALLMAWRAVSKPIRTVQSTHSEAHGQSRGTSSTKADLADDPARSEASWLPFAACLPDSVLPGTIVDEDSLPLHRPYPCDSTVPAFGLPRSHDLEAEQLSWFRPITHECRSACPVRPILRSDEATSPLSQLCRPSYCKTRTRGGPLESFDNSTGDRR